MEKVKIKKVSYTLPGGNRVVETGIYDKSLFSEKEITYLQDTLKSLVVVEEVPEKATIKTTRTRTEKQKFGKSLDHEEKI